MNEKKESQLNNSLDTLKWSMVCALLIAGIGLNYYYASLAVSLRLIGWLILICAVGAIAFQTQKGRKTWEFAQQAWVELQKVVWPTRNETIKVTMVVVAMVVVVALILWMIDSGLLWTMGLLTGQRGK